MSDYNTGFDDGIEHAEKKIKQLTAAVAAGSKDLLDMHQVASDYRAALKEIDAMNKEFSVHNFYRAKEIARKALKGQDDG